MGVAELLMCLTQTFDGKVKLMFQPGEEGAGGALAMIRDGILDDPAVTLPRRMPPSTRPGSRRTS